MRRILTAFLVVAAASLTAVALHRAARADDKAAETAARPIRALLVCGGCCHDYARQKDILSKGISARANVEITIAYDPDKTDKHLNPVYENDDWAKGYDVVIHDECSAYVTDMKIVDRVLKPHKEGLPAVVLHCGMHCYRTEGWDKKGVTPWFAFTGLQSSGHGAQKPIAITFVDTQSPITKGMENWTTVNEELYNNYAGGILGTAHALARGKQGKDDDVVVWTNNYDKKTRVFATTLGHNNATVADDRYLDLVARGLLWATNHLTEDGKPAPGYEGKK